MHVPINVYAQLILYCSVGQTGQLVHAQLGKGCVEYVPGGQLHVVAESTIAGRHHHKNKVSLGCMVHELVKEWDST